MVFGKPKPDFPVPGILMCGVMHRPMMVPEREERKRPLATTRQMRRLQPCRPPNRIAGARGIIRRSVKDFHSTVLEWMIALIGARRAGQSSPEDESRKPLEAFHLIRQVDWNHKMIRGQFVDLGGYGLCSDLDSTRPKAFTPYVCFALAG
jgi:hypothetical protein